MLQRVCWGLMVVMMFASVAWGSDPDLLLQKLERKVGDAKAGKVAEYAPDSLKDVAVSISTAQTAIAAGNPKLAMQKIDLATLQLSFAEAKAVEREFLEQVAVERVELKRLEALLERYLQGEEK